MASPTFAIDYDNDGAKDSILNVYYYHNLTTTFDLPFEPYAFTISYQEDKVHRIF